MTTLAEYCDSFARYIEGNVSSESSHPYSDQEVFNLISENKTNVNHKAEIKNVLDRLTEAWSKKYNLSNNILVSEKEFLKTGFWPHYLYTVYDTHESYRRTKDLNRIEDIKRNIDETIRHIQAAATMINRLPNEATHYSYTVDQVTPDSKSEYQRILKLNFPQVLEMNKQSLEKLSGKMENQLESDKEYFTNKSKTLGIRFASITCQNRLNEFFDLSAATVTAKIVSLLTGEAIERQDVKDFLKTHNE